MKTIRIAMLLTFTALLTSRGEGARFFRIAGPVPTAITAFSADGYVTWTNVPTNATFIVQTALSFPSPSNWVDYTHVPSTNPATTHRLFDANPPPSMAFIPAGSFTMGDTFGEGNSAELPLHLVYASAFYMERHEVTKALWDDVFHWATNHGYSFEYGAQGKTNTHPVNWVTWFDAVKWCNARSEKTGRTPAYYTEAGRTAVYRTGETNIQNDWVKWDGGYRLPTESEWEKAARGGASGWRFPWGDTIAHSQANYFASSNYIYDLSLTLRFHPNFNDGTQPYSNPVGYFAANGYGLYDMTGNMWEWCWDRAGFYSVEPQIDPRGPEAGPGRMYRGGSFGDYAWTCRLSIRGAYEPTFYDYRFGFRTVLPSVQ